MRSISDGPALVSEVCQTGQSRSDRYCKILFRLLFSRRVCPMSISCPSCSSQRIHRSRRKGFLESGPLTLMFVRPFRCEQCDHRFFRLSFSANPGVPPAGRTWLPLVRGR
jgi:DNA-directed RNA polymerase subunit RPC12/RpoP